MRLELFFDARIAGVEYGGAVIRRHVRQFPEGDHPVFPFHPFDSTA